MVLRMGIGILGLIVLYASWVCDARQLMTSEMAYAGSGLKNDQVCTLCETYATQAVVYLSQNKTQQEVIDLLHTSCSRLRSLEDECVTLVDYYAPLFFMELSTVQPEEFCEKVNLCELVPISSQLSDGDSCSLCHQTVAEVIEKLQDPDTQLDILELLLKGCNSLEKKFVKKCKRMVFEYAPVLLTNGAKFLESTDLCTTLHACDPKVSSI
ncbi:unnamed protein product [Rhodiola kirilowii]